MKHSVVLNEKRCRGCTSCVKCCPTEAIRVRGRKATILADRCIDCGRCISVCPHKAIRSVGDDLSCLQNFSYCVALPEPALFGQFHRLSSIDLVLNALLALGFDKVWEVSRAAEILADSWRSTLRSGFKPPPGSPLISATCPTVLRLIRMRFPKLIPQVVPSILPMELAAILARREAAAETGLSPDRIGVFAIVPCTAKVTAAQAPEGLQKPVLDGAFSIRDIYLRLLSPMKDIESPEPMCHSGSLGNSIAYCGGSLTAHPDSRSIAVDGIGNVIRILETMEDGRLDEEADYVELAACPQGCLGGCFNVENPYTAKMRLKEVISDLPFIRNRLDVKDLSLLHRDKELQYLPSLLLDEDRQVALMKELQMQQLELHLPGLQCGSCGAPSCRAFAEDVVMGRASEDDCIFKVRARLAADGEPDSYLPAPFRQQNKNSDQST